MKAFLSELARRLADSGYLVHRGNGQVYCLRRGCSTPGLQLVRFSTTGYLVHAIKGPMIPRLKIERRARVESAPAIMARRWKGHLSAIHPRDEPNTMLEITFLEAEQGVVVDAALEIVRMFEAGVLSDFHAAFQTVMKWTVPSNLWTAGADAFATQAAVSNGQFERTPKR